MGQKNIRGKASKRHIKFDVEAVTFRRQREPFSVSTGMSLIVFMTKLPSNIGTIVDPKLH